MTKHIVVTFVMCFIIGSFASAQEGPHVELRHFVDSPTAGLLPRGSYAVDLQLFPSGGMLARVAVGLLSRVTAGFSYGGLNIIGRGELDWNPAVEFQAKLRIKDETFIMPAIAFGFDSQGYGAYDDEEERYEIKSKGAYAVLSKSFWMVGPLGLHAGANYSLEDDDGDDDISFFGGIDKDLFAGSVVVAEYDLALNDDREDEKHGAGRGYLNAGLRWTFADKLTLEFDLKNLADNREDSPHVGREVRIVYWSRF